MFKQLFTFFKACCSIESAFHFHPRLIFAGKARAYPSGDPMRLVSKDKLVLEPSLTIRPGSNVIKLFNAIIDHHFMVITIILCDKAILPWKLPLNGNKLLRYFNPRKSRVNITAVIYCCIVL